MPFTHIQTQAYHIFWFKKTTKSQPYRLNWTHTISCDSWLSTYSMKIIIIMAVCWHIIIAFGIPIKPLNRSTAPNYPWLHRTACRHHNRAAQRQSVRSTRSETTDFTFDEDAPADGDPHSTLIRRDVTFSEWICWTSLQNLNFIKLNWKPPTKSQRREEIKIVFNLWIRINNKSVVKVIATYWYAISSKPKNKNINDLFTV